MLNYFIKRALGVIPTLLIVAVLVFLFVHLLPGDPARLAAGPEADEMTVDLVRKDLGLDKPMHEQFVAPTRSLADLVVVGRGDNGVVVDMFARSLASMADGEAALWESPDALDG